MTLSSSSRVLFSVIFPAAVIVSYGLAGFVGFITLSTVTTILASALVNTSFLTGAVSTYFALVLVSFLISKESSKSQVELSW